MTGHARRLVRAFALALLCAATPSPHAQEAEADLTPALTSAAAWDSPALSEGWARTLADGPRVFRTRFAPCKMLDRRLTSVTGCFENGTLTSFTAVFLDSGAWFGYVPDAQAKATAAARGADFARLFHEVSAEVPRRLTQLFASREETTLGRTPWLKQTVVVLRHDSISARLTIIPEQLVKLSVFRNADHAVHLLDPSRRETDRARQTRDFAAAVRATPLGDRILTNIPVFPQGDRAYCGVSTLASVMRFCGLTLDTEDYAAAAGIRFGSTRKSHIREVYDAAAKEGALRMFHSTKFEWGRAQQSIDAGFPVVVFRRWNQERDYLHTAFARRFAADPTVALPRADANDRKNWPTSSAFAHASIVNGYNARRREIIFTESWNENARNRRMRTEEMEATTYLAYYPRL